MVIKVEYHANANYENPLKHSEKLGYIGQRSMYPIMEKIPFYWNIYC